MQQFCITAFKYGGLYRTFYDRCSKQYFVENSRPTSAKIKTTDNLRCKLLTQSKHVKIYNNLRISLNEALFLAHLSRRLIGELIVYRSSRRPCVRASVHTSKHEYLCDWLADWNEILSEASLGWGKGCSRF